MNLDLRLPMGLMFLITGAMMTIFGIFTWGSPIYEKSMGMNINLIWGLGHVRLWHHHVPAWASAGDETGQTGPTRTRRRIAQPHRPLGAGRTGGRAFGAFWDLKLLRGSRCSLLITPDTESRQSKRPA